MKELFNDGNVKLSLSYIDELPFLHVEADKLSKEMYQKYLVLFHKVLKENGLSKVYSSCRTEKARKFNELFGFNFLGQFEERMIMEYHYDWS